MKLSKLKRLVLLLPVMIVVVLFNVSTTTISDNNNTVHNSNLSADANQIEVDISKTSDEAIFIKDYGIYSLSSGQNISANIDWDGDGSIMILYTNEDLELEDIKKFCENGILPFTNNRTFNNGTNDTLSLSSNFTYERQSGELNFNFITEQNKPITWNNEVTATKKYRIFLIATGDTGITNIRGAITL